MKKLLIILVAFSCKAQDTLVFSKPDLFKRNYVEFGYGKPQETLSNKYESSINIGYWVRNKVNRNQFVDLGLELNFLKAADTVNYRFNNENIRLIPNDIGLNLGVRYSRMIFLSQRNQDFYLETNSGLGWSALFYKKSQEIIKKEYDFIPNVNTIHLTQNIQLNYKSFGIYVQYKYTPYNLFNKNFENNFGNTSINVGLVKGFNF